MQSIHSLSSSKSQRYQSLSQDVVFINSDLKGFQTLAARAYPWVTVVILNSLQDGISQITAALASLQPMRRIHLITAGTPACLTLGNVPLSFASLPRYANDLDRWRSHLTKQSEILIYNHQVASDEAGKLLIDVLHHVTGAAIAAAISPFGMPLQPQGWELDCATQSFTPFLAFPPSVVAAYFTTVQPNRCAPSLYSRNRPTYKRYLVAV